MPVTLKSPAGTLPKKASSSPSKFALRQSQTSQRRHRSPPVLESCDNSKLSSQGKVANGTTVKSHPLTLLFGAPLTSDLPLAASKRYRSETACTTSEKATQHEQEFSDVATVCDAPVYCPSATRSAWTQTRSLLITATGKAVSDPQFQRTSVTLSNTPDVSSRDKHSCNISTEFYSQLCKLTALLHCCK